MELLIPGLILVALMVYASTRIKRIAAEAFEPETVETDEFVIQKADGFLNVINGDPKYAFEAYSKEFGTDNAQEIRQGTVKLVITDGGSADTFVNNIKTSDAVVVTELNEVIGEVRYRVVETKRQEKGVEYKVLYKVAERSGKAYELEAAMLSETTGEFKRKIETMLDSFEIK